MRAELWAVLAALCWSLGSLFEKKGVSLGQLSPVMGTTVRTAVSLVLLSVISFPFWGQVRAAGLKPVLLIALGGGVLAGSLGVISLYSGLKSGNLSTVMTLAFCLTPIFAAFLGCIFLQEKLRIIQVFGIILCVSGAALVTYYK